MATGLLLDVAAGAKAGTQVVLGPMGKDKESACCWSIEPVGPQVALIHKADGWCLDGFGSGKSPGTMVDLYPYRGAVNQRWSIFGVR